MHAARLGEETLNTSRRGRRAQLLAYHASEVRQPLRAAGRGVRSLVVIAQLPPCTIDASTSVFIGSCASSRYFSRSVFLGAAGSAASVVAATSTGSMGRSKMPSAEVAAT